MIPNETQEEMPANEMIENIFSYHAPKSDQAQRYERLRNFAKSFAYVIHQSCPDSGDRDAAFHYLNIAVMSANASIARNE